jgi:Cu/Zn superoxide dismutase
MALVAVACTAALPAAALANHDGKHGSKHKVKPAKHVVLKGKGAADRAGVRLSPAAGQTAKGVVHLKQHANALTVSLVVSRLAPGAFYAAHLHAGSCAAPGAAALTFPDVYANEHGVATLVTTVPTAAGANYLAGGYSIDVHAGPASAPGAAISCGDLPAKVAKAYAKAWLKGAAAERGQVELYQKGSDVRVWIKLRGLTPGAHALQIHAGSCAAPGAAVVSLGDVTAGADGKVSQKITASSTIPVVGKGFSVDVYAGPSAAAGAVAACGDQTQWWKKQHRWW